MHDEEVHEDESTQHYRTLFERGQSYFKGKYTRRNRSTIKAYEELTIVLEKIPLCLTIEDLKTLESTLNSSSMRHIELCQELIQYCERTKTITSMESAKSKRMTLQVSEIFVNSAMHQIKKKIKEMTFDKYSSVSSGSRRSSRSSHSSKRSNISSEIIRTKAKTEVAKTRLKYVKLASDVKKKQALLEATVMKEKADISAELELLEVEQEVAAAEAEAEVLEASEGSQLSSQDHLNTLEPGDSVKRTKDYVEQITFSKRENIASTDQNNNHDDSHTAYNINYLPNHVNESSLNPKVEPFYPSQNVVSDFTRYLLKKDVLLTRLSGFDDRPESYLTWKVSFRTVMEELNVTALE